MFNRVHTNTHQPHIFTHKNIISKKINYYWREVRSADRSFGASKKPERDAVALSRHMIIKGNKPDWPYVYATSARRNEQVTYVQTSHAYGRCSAPALGNFKPRSGRTRRGSGGPMPRARSGLVTKKGKLTLSLSWPAKSDSECRGLRSFPI
jgi:hypothetical protein